MSLPIPLSLAGLYAHRGYFLLRPPPPYVDALRGGAQDEDGGGVGWTRAGRLHGTDSQGVHSQPIPTHPGELPTGRGLDADSVQLSTGQRTAYSFWGVF
jgi:hypothetical protein